MMTVRLWTDRVNWPAGLSFRELLEVGVVKGASLFGPVVTGGGITTTAIVMVTLTLSGLCLCPVPLRTASSRGTVSPAAPPWPLHTALAAVERGRSSPRTYIKAAPLHTQGLQPRP